MIDHLGRNIDYLRISLTDRCNLRCLYCMGEKGIDKVSHSDILSYERIYAITKVLASLGIKKVRLTGGEPLVRKEVAKLVMMLRSIEGIKEICLTTNATLLKKAAKDLKAAGLDRLNISLDSLDSQKYAYITRGGDLKDALEGIKEAQKYFDKIKINAVLLKGFNDDEIDDYLKFAKSEKLYVRFIELMPLGVAKTYRKFLLDPLEVLDKRADLKKLPDPDGVAELYELKDSPITIGAIRALSHSFCSRCNRLRLTADGHIKPCLFAKEEIDVSALDDKELYDTLKDIIYHKPDNKESVALTGRLMNEIGG